VNQACYRIIGNDLTVTLAAEAGQLQVYVMEPVIADCILNSQTLFMNSAQTLREHCISGITINEKVCRRHVEHSIGLVTALNLVIGYDTATKPAAEALESGRGIVELVRE
jgi:aspartate ammonia-lyase